ncbi:MULTISPECIES: DUF397 domain-containing protein [Streptomyces]|jgi:hypothetical protein|uniref:DUF397 domain-containing protein n=1 Tax=Streptomyces TaxID=1883 RepID=UPI0011652E77|nr:MULTISPECIES: DUF397 domain-containing protein [unclassified Streptomyces]NMI61785.1 DUF397 domain-containing protein [Streptomyces sp. RLA2-12]QDN60858.1 DUF397 domain-containing protein [Streptomyces sp. S1D4-20]QDN70912.1 DUF397 domain-containing protein [Streptomyces sp. S1D4-14]QDO53368.1 DUF397 domain-containing protein [Streptomyces sp. RLB3-5]QDO63613.1 DUF397 domain-containing protein [Streptomyces sp. RLB1-8]
MSTTELAWFKSTYSGSEGDDCVEVALSWRKSTYSSGSEGDCVEVATCPTTIHIRDSKHTPGPQLALSPTTWTEFVEFAVREGVDGSR